MDLKDGQYGSICRVGLVVPSLNVVIEPEFHKMSPEGVSVHATRMLLQGKMTRESFSRMAQDASTAAALLGTARVDVIAYACTSGSFVEDGARIAETLEREGGVPAVTTALAVVEALHALGLKRIAVGTPYVDFVNEAEKQFLESAGFEVTGLYGLGLGDTPESRISIGRQKWEMVLEVARRIDSPDADGVFISCTNLATIGVLEQLEQELGKPVFSSNVATFWSVLSRGGFSASIPGYGSLLRDFPSLPKISAGQE
ncbi:MAG TPA: decarboxylase [Nitrospinae bacterium]|nr:decarboxylase [Nitrospinota bacterium]